MLAARATRLDHFSADLGAAESEDGFQGSRHLM